MSKSFAPKGYNTISPYLLVADVVAQIEFLKAAFGGEQIEFMTKGDGTPAHAEVRIADSVIMMGQVVPENVMPAMLYIYVEDCDTAFNAAVAAGATSLNEPADQFYGDRTAAVQGPQGNQWWIAQSKTQYSSDELQQRMKDEHG